MPFWTFSHFETAIPRKPLENLCNRNDVFYVVFYKFSGDTSYFSSEQSWKFTIFDNIIVIIKMKNNLLAKTHNKNWAEQHSELLYWTSNGKFKSKMDLPLEKVSKIKTINVHG